MTGSTDDERRGSPFRPGDESMLPAGLCPRCGRALADEDCLHCAAEDELRGGALVRRFVSHPDLYSTDPFPSPDHGTGEWPPPGAEPPGQARHAADERERGVRRARRERVDTTPPVPTEHGRHLLDPVGWGPRGLVAKTIIVSAPILAAAAVGIVGAVVVAPPSNIGAPSPGPTPGATQPGDRPPQGAANPSTAPGDDEISTAPAVAPRTPGTRTRAVTGEVAQGSFCLDNFSSGTGNGNPIQMWRCDITDAQRWTFATDGTVRVSGKCMRPVGGASDLGTKLELWECDGSPSQQWLRGVNDSLVHPASGGCLENPATDDAYGARPQLSLCGDGAGQRWSLPYSGLS